MFNKILVALDTSETCTHLFDQALALAQATGAKLTLFSVLSSDYGYRAVLPYYPVITGFPTIDDEALKVYQKEYSEYEKKAEEMLSSWCNQAENEGVQAEFVQAIGDPGRAICDRAKTDNVDLIIMGSHGRKGLNKLLIGSVSNYVMHHALCSVMVVHHLSEPPHLEKAQENSRASTV